jgi:hypothetical protein
MHCLNFRIIKPVVVWMQRFEICDFVCKKVCIKWGTTLVQPALPGKVPDYCVHIKLFLSRSGREFCNNNYEEATGAVELLLFPEAAAMESAVRLLPRLYLAYARAGHRYVEAVGIEDGGGRG